MRRVAHRTFVLVLSIALAVSGSALGAAAHAAPKATAHAGHAAPAVSQHAHAHHHGVQTAGVPTPDHSSAPKPADHAETCCSMCVVASPVPPVFDSNVMFRVSPVRFFEPRSYRVGRTIQIDPGIPKPTV